VSLRHAAWQASSYTGDVLVRAADVDAARKLATGRFGRFIEVSPGEATFLDPWTQPRLATCTREAQSSYPEVGPAEVLTPALAEGPV
jgi:hypothetical protein